MYVLSFFSNKGKLFKGSTKIAKARPGFDDRPEHPSVQINSSSPCNDLCHHLYVVC